MSKKILVLYYTQSGQLQDITDNFAAPLIEAGHSVEKLQIRPVNDFPFPWTTSVFFEAMPESVLGIPAELEAFRLKETKYDLVIFAYQPWFLSPSIPANSILQHPAIRAVLNDAPVITLIGARNMWLNAQEKTKKFLKDAGAKLVGNVALVDKNNNHVSVVTIFYWMLTGKKDRKWGIFPRPGVADEDISRIKIYGEIAGRYLAKGYFEGMQQELVTAKAVEIKYSLMYIESKAGFMFSIWAKKILGSKKRKVLLVAFKYYLLIALFVAAPIILLIHSILVRPFLISRTKKKFEYFSGVN
ncbi:MAG: hypothetical protein ABI861_04335 [Panacibacter sp.]